MSKRRKYSNQLKGECIEMVVGLGMRPKEVAKQMNVSYDNIRHWIKQHHKGIALVRSNNTLHIEVRKWKS